MGQGWLERVIAPENRIGIQVHGGSRFGGPKGTWYKGLKYRELTDNGAPAAAAAKSGSEALGLEDAGQILPVRFSASATDVHVVAVPASRSFSGDAREV